DITAKSEKGTVFYIPLTGTEEITVSNFITFINKDTTVVQVKDGYQVDLTGIQMNFEFDLTPDAEVQVIFDPKIGDVIKGKGRGHLTMEINTLGKFSIFGEYIIEEGDYLFTLMNVINKRFKVEKGGTIKWTGDPYNAQVDINAIYRLRTSLYDLGQYIDTTKKRVPVNVMLKMKEDLLSPDIHFDIKLPGADEITKNQLRTLLYNEQELNQQVFALLTLNRFVPPLSSGGGNSENSHAGIHTTSSTELLSNQLSNWLSQISNEFDVGVNYRPGDDISSQELEVALSTQLLNDRVILDGNVGVSNNQAVATQQTNNMVGEFNVEYKISEDGRFRVRGFNRPNGANQIYVNSNYTQGVGLFYRVEFNSFGELYHRYRNILRRKESEMEKPETEGENDWDSESKKEKKETGNL
ncbi:MAG: translocation/assembly module TamB, partial [Bacteroidota bacterium]|nr:translocation/assembly module TamB [Bacteroidota bacterium]